MRRVNLKTTVLSLLIIIGLTIVSCSSEDDNNLNNNNSCISGATIQGEGPIVTRTLSIEDFNSINASGRANITITQGNTQEVTATGQANIIEAITTGVNNDIWDIGLEGPCGYSYDELSINIVVPNINKIESGGINTIVVNDFNNQTELAIDLGGSGSLTLNAFEGITALDFSAGGTGSFTANKDITTLNTLNINQSGAFEYSGFNINVDDCTIIAGGTGTTEVTVQNNLDVTISGTATVRYKGNPTITQNISGTGQLIEAN
ncbi:GIN domain-containing protein [Tenacibaculum aiptasiae]|uniref:GIN domain-containing protein n=1 Tax=Tenacibaculum aiptasiae TaxID=426481 RepID=UPI003B597753